MNEGYGNFLPVSDSKWRRAFYHYFLGIFKSDVFMYTKENREGYPNPVPLGAGAVSTSPEKYI